MEDRVGDAAVVHQHGDAPADADDERHAQQVRAARHEGLGDLILPHAVDEADDDAAHQEQGGEFREPPAQNRQGQAHLVKGDDAVDHDEKGQGEEGHDDLALRREGHGLVHGDMNFSRADAHHGFGGVLLDPGGVGHDEPDGRALEHDPLEDPEQNALPQRYAGKARRDAGGKGVHRGGDDAGAGPQQDDGNAHHRVIARGQKHRDQQRIKGHGLLPHAIRRAAQAKQQH